MIIGLSGLHFDLSLYPDEPESRDFEFSSASLYGPKTRVENQDRSFEMQPHYFRIPSSLIRSRYFSISFLFK